MKSLLAVLICLSVLTSCNERKVDTRAEGEKLMQVSREWAKVANTGDLEKIMSFWADSARFLYSGRPVLNGKTEIRNMVEESGKMPGFQITWEPLSVSVSETGDMGYMIEQNKITMNDSLGKPLVKYGKVVTIWKKDAKGDWKNVVEIGVDDPDTK